MSSRDEYSTREGVEDDSSSFSRKLPCFSAECYSLTIRDPLEMHGISGFQLSELPAISQRCFSPANVQSKEILTTQQWRSCTHIPTHVWALMRQDDRHVPIHVIPIDNDVARMQATLSTLSTCLSCPCDAWAIQAHTHPIARDAH